MQFQLGRRMAGQVREGVGRTLDFLTNESKEGPRISCMELGNRDGHIVPNRYAET